MTDDPGNRGPLLERAILDLLASRAADATICPSEAARLVARQAPEGEASFRALMPAARAAAHALAVAGDVEVTQRGDVVDIRAARGPVRIRRRQDSR